MEIKHYNIELNDSMTYFDFYLNKILTFLNDKQIIEFRELCKKTNMDVFKLTDYLDSLNLGTFKFIEISRCGLISTYMLIRVII